MKILDTFTIVEESLFSVRYENEDLNEFRRLFQSWNDPEYLHRFFSANSKDLNRSIWGFISIEEAIERTRKQAKTMEKRILQMAVSGKSSKQNLSEYFQPMSPNMISKELELDKGKGLINPNWLRIYAVRVDANCFVVSGGGIKLTKDIQGSPHLMIELQKLDVTREYIRDGGDDDLDSVYLT